MSKLDTEEANRRPLAVRQWTFFQRIAARLSQTGLTPNAISVSSTLFALLTAACLVGTAYLAEGTVAQRALWLAAGLFVQMRLIANLLDGMVAIEGGKKSVVGELYNEVPDRISDVAVLVAAGYAATSDARLGFVAAIIALFVAYVRAIGASVGVGQIFTGPCAKQQRMALMTLACLLHGLLPVAWNYQYDGRLGYVALALGMIILGGIVTSVRRLLRIATLMKQITEVP